MSIMGYCRRSSRIIFDGFRCYNSKNPIQESISRTRLHTFSSRPNFGEFWVKKKQLKSPFVDGAKNFYNVDSNNHVYEFLPSRGWRRWIWNVENAVAMAFFGTGVAFVLCFGKWETVPYTKRNHLVFLSASLYDEDFGERNCEEIKKVFKEKVLPPLHPDSVRVRKIAHDLIDAFRRGSRDDDRSKKCVEGWEVMLVDVPANMITSFPGGKFVIFSGLLHYWGEDAQIATFIGRELGRVVARHAMEMEAMLELISSILLLILHVFLNSRPSLLKYLRFPFARSAVYAITWTAVSRLLQKFYTLKMDVEADYIGLLLVASAGYDPRVALQVREKIGKIRGDSRWEKMRTQLLALHLDEALSVYREVQASTN